MEVVEVEGPVSKTLVLLLVVMVWLEDEAVIVCKTEPHETAAPPDVHVLPVPVAVLVLVTILLVVVIEVHVALSNVSTIICALIVLLKHKKTKLIKHATINWNTHTEARRWSGKTICTLQGKGLPIVGFWLQSMFKQGKPNKGKKKSCANN